MLWPALVYSEFKPWILFDLQSLRAAGGFLRDFLHPAHSLEFLAMVLRETWITVAIATAGLALALLGAIPATLLVSERLSISRLGTGRIRPLAALVRQVVRWVLVLLRSVPELVWALLFVRVVGLGPTAGVLAIALTYCGMLAKVYAEILESSDAHATDALLANGSRAPARPAVRRPARRRRRTGVVHRLPLGMRDPRLGHHGLCRRRRPGPAHGRIDQDDGGRRSRHHALHVRAAGGRRGRGLDPAAPEARMNRPSPPPRNWSTPLLVLALVALVVASFATLRLDLAAFFTPQALSTTAEFLGGFAPPEMATPFLLKTLNAALETLSMSALGTLLAVVAGLRAGAAGGRALGFARRAAPCASS